MIGGCFAAPIQADLRRSAGSLPELTQIFLRKNAANLLTAAPTKRLHHLLEPSLIMGVKEWSPRENQLNGLAFIVAFWPGKI